MTPPRRGAVRLLGLFLATTIVLAGWGPPSAVALGPAPRTAAAPWIAGPLRVGSNLAARVGIGSWPYGTDFEVQWLANGVPVAGATRPILFIGRRLLGMRIRVRVTATPPSGQRTTVGSLPTDRVAKGRIVLERPRLGGAGRVGRLEWATLDAMTETSTPTTDVPGTWAYQVGGGPDVRFRWYADGRLIRGATLGYLRLGRAQLGKHLVAREIASYPGFIRVAKSSARSEPVRR